MTKEELYKMYDNFKGGCQTHILHVLFEKADKSTREMYCTLNSRLITEYGCPLPQSSQRDVYMGTLRIFDLQKLESRTIPLKRIQNFQWLTLDSKIPPGMLNLTI
jgi:hypothetical protein